MKRHSGFTLIELLVALAVLALIAAVLFDGLKFALRASERGIARATALHEVTTAQRFLRGRIETLYQFDVERGSEPLGYPVDGDARSISFSAPLPSGAYAPGYFRYTVEATPNSRGSADLIVKWRADRNGREDSADRAGPSEETLLENIDRFEVAYLTPEPEGPARWSDRWADRSGAPVLVRLRVIFPAGDRRMWPDLVASPRVTSDANCAF